MVYAQPSICPREWNTQTPLGLWHTNGSPNLGQKIRAYYNQQKKENLQNCGFCCPGWPQKKTESEKKDKYLDLARELKKKLWNMKVTIIPIMIGAFGTVTKGLLMGLDDLEFGGWAVTIPTIALWWMAGILRRVLEFWVDLVSLKLQGKTISKCWCEKLLRSK